MPDQDKTKGGLNLSSQTGSSFKEGTNYLLAIGINDYKHHQRLNNAVEDAKALADMLTERYNFSPEHVTRLFNEDATNENILEQLAAFQQLSTDDNLLIFFSGHGFYKNRVGYLVAHDSKASPPVRFINNSILFDELSQIPARHILLIADSCFSGSLFKGGDKTVSAIAEKAERIPSRYALSAGNIELVSDGIVGNHSPFTRELLKVLQANEQAKLPVSHVFHEVRGMVTYAKQQPLGGPIHKLSEHWGGEFVFNLRQNEDAAFEKAKASYDPNILRDFLEVSTNLEYKKIIRQILLKLEEKVEGSWQQVNKHNLVELDKFVNEQPGSPFALEARHLMVELKAQAERQRREAEQAWQKVNKNSYAALDEFLDENPGSPYTTEARKRRAELKAQADVNRQKRFEENDGVGRSLDPFHDLMVHIEGGSFKMGDEHGDLGAQPLPVHQVTVKDFYLCKYPVTQAQWKLIMVDNPSGFEGDDLPVEKVSWDNAQAFIKKLNERTGGYFRLPSEAEWEFAARGGKKSKGYKYSGSDDIDEVAWYSKNAGSKTHPAGQKKANELDLFDMSGNVWEWCEDDWHDTYGKAPDDGSAWIDAPKRGAYRVLRGGGWLNNPLNCRLAYRDWISPGLRHVDLGFRLARSLQ